MSRLSIKIGHFLFRHAFPVYNAVYPIIKNKQDKREIELLRRYVKPGFTVLDIGANIGFYTRILSDLAGPHGHVFSFEPDRVNFSHLKANCSGLNNVTLINKAVGATDGMLKIYRSPVLNVDHRTYPVENFESVEEISCTALDSFFSGGKKIDFIKIDIQGFELSAFEGMQGLLEANPQIHILSEFWPFGLRKAGRSSGEFLHFFFDRGLPVYLVKYDSFEQLTPQNFSAYDSQEESVYMNIFVTPKA